jgi:pimeloyl-ACP methyl ester carboxylesterase
MSNYILLHDAFQSGDAWERVELELQELGCRVVAPSFAGCGGQGLGQRCGSPAHAFLDNLETLLAGLSDQQTIVVCTGYSGMLAPALAERIPADTCVFLDAVLPEPGKSYLDVCPSSLARKIRENTDAQTVRPFSSGPLHRLGPASAALESFPLEAFTESYAGPARHAWPKSLYISCSGDREDPHAGRDQIEAPGMEWQFMDLDAYPVLGRAGEVARLLADLGAEAKPRRGACCGNPMPHELRMMYCAHYRRRMEMCAVHSR